MRPALITMLALGCAVPLPPQTGDPSALALTGVIDLTVSNVVPGATTRMTVSGLDALETVAIVRSTIVQPGPCPPVLVGQCLEIGPVVSMVGSIAADADGVAVLDILLPVTVPLGVNVAFQAIAVRGVGGADSALSLGVGLITGGLPCGNGILDVGEVCDDGNLANGDGCSDVCDLETCSVPELPVDARVHDFADHDIFDPGGVTRLANGDLMAAFSFHPGTEEYVGLATLSSTDLSLLSTAGLGTLDDEQVVRVLADSVAAPTSSAPPTTRCGEMR